MHGVFFPIGSHGPAHFPPILVKKSAFKKNEFFKRKFKKFKHNVTLK